jgi:hypothetical protein
VTRWINRALFTRALRKRPIKFGNRTRISLEALEDRTTPATSLASPTLLDPITPVRVDLGSYAIRGNLADPAKNGTSALAYRDSNQNGTYDANVDALAGSAAVTKGTTSFAVTVPLQQDAANQFFLIAADGKLRSAPVKTGLITEDSTPPTVTSITRLGNTLTSADTVQFKVTFSEPVTGVDATDFQVVASGSVSSGTVTVTGSGSVYTVTLSGISGEGTLALNLADDDSIRDVMTNPAQAHPLGGIGAGNGDFTAGEGYTVDTVAPAAPVITRTTSVVLNGRVATFTATFDEAVLGVDAADFALAASGLTGVAITGVTGSGSTYTVTANVGTGAGSLRLDLAAGATVTDLAGNALADASAGGATYLVLSENTDSLATVVLPAININLLGLHIQTSEIIVSVAADAGNGKLLGNLLTTASNLINLQQAADALNQILGTTVNLLNSSDLGINLGAGSFDARPAATTDVLTLHVAPVDLDLLGALVNTAPIDVRISAESGQGLILGNIVYDLSNLFNDLPGQTLNIDTLNQKLGDLLGLVNTAVGLIPAADVPIVQPAEGQVLSLTVPALDLNLLGLNLQTSPITVNADAQEGNGNLLGNVLTSLLNTLDATPDKVAQLNNTLNAVLARVVGVLNAADLVVSPLLVSALPPAIQTLLDPVLVAPAGSSAPILDLVIASQDGTTPPVDVNLLGLNVTTSNIDARLFATTGDGLILGNLLYNVANLANPNGTGGLLALLNALGAGNLDSTAGSDGGSLSGTTSAPQQLLQIRLNPLDLNLLGLEVQSDPIVVTLSTQGGDGKLLGNLLGAISTLVNFPGVEAALNNVLGTVVDLVNSVDLTLPPDLVGSGEFDNAEASTTTVLDVFVAPVHLDLLGLVVTTNPIHLTVTAHAGDGLVLGNVVTALAHLFDNPPETLTVDEVNLRLEQLLADLNAMIPNIPPAESPPVTLEPDQFLELTVPTIDLNLLGLLLKTSPITVNAFDQTGNGNLLGNFLNSLLNTIDATPGNLTALSENLNALLAKVVGVLNAADLSLAQAALDALPAVLQTLLSPVLISPTPGETAQILDLLIASPDGTTPPVTADLLGLVVTTSDIHAELLAQTGDGQVLGNLLYNVANLLNQGNTASLLLLLAELALPTQPA